jgi:hypothetical protein
MDAIASATCMHHSSDVVSAPISLANTQVTRLLYLAYEEVRPLQGQYSDKHYMLTIS